MTRNEGPRPLPDYARLWDWARTHQSRVKVAREGAGVLVVSVMTPNGADVEASELGDVDVQAADIIAQIQGAGWWE